MLSATETFTSPEVQAGMLASELATGMNTTLANQSSPTATTEVRRDSARDSKVGAANIVTATHGLGLQGSYYNGGDLSTTPVTRIDNAVNFNWGRTAPVKKVLGGTFAVDWTGELVAPRTGTFTFYVRSIGGADLTIDGTTLIDNTGSSPPRL